MNQNNPYEPAGDGRTSLVARITTLNSTFILAAIVVVGFMGFMHSPATGSGLELSRIVSRSEPVLRIAIWAFLVLGIVFRALGLLNTLALFFALAILGLAYSFVLFNGYRLIA